MPILFSEARKKAPIGIVDCSTLAPSMDTSKKFEMPGVMETEGELVSDLWRRIRLLKEPE